MTVFRNLRPTFVAVALSTATALLPFAHVYGDDTLQSSVESLRKEVQAVREGQQELRNDLQEIKRVLSRKEEPIRKDPVQWRLSLNQGPAKGEPSAQVIVVEFSDYECPFCARHFREILPKLERQYISTGKIRYLFRNFPIEAAHKNALFAAEAALCADAQGKYWEMHDSLFAAQAALQKDRVLERAQPLGLDLAVFQRCLDQKAKQEVVRNDVRTGAAAGVSGTPMFFIGRAEKTERENGIQLEVYHTVKGAASFETFQTAIDNLLAK